MAVSKRTRYEVLRRDNFTCRYCGGKAPDVELHVDHVTPVALGGTDKPNNLVAACVDCNHGKASTKPDAETVADVSDEALRWARAMALAGEQLNTLSDAQDEYVDTFSIEWDSYRQFDRAIPTPPNWRGVIVGYYNSHLPVASLTDAIAVTMSRRDVENSERFRYFCGVVRNKLADQTSLAAAILERGGI